MQKPIRYDLKLTRHRDALSRDNFAPNLQSHAPDSMARSMRNEYEKDIGWSMAKFVRLNFPDLQPACVLASIERARQR